MSDQNPPCSLNTPELHHALPEPAAPPPSDAASTSTASSSGKPRNRRGPPAPRVDVTRPSQNSNLLFSPRPCVSLYTERAYLEQSLQWQVCRAADLLNRHSLAKAHLLSLENGKEKRQLLKKLKLLESKLNEAVEQRKVIYSRLGELSVESQSRDTWTLAAHQAAFSPTGFNLGPLPAFSPVESMTPMSPLSGGVLTPTAPMNAVTPDFDLVPWGYFPTSQQMPQGQYQDWAESSQEPCSLRTVHEAAENVPGEGDVGIDSLENLQLQGDDAEEAGESNESSQQCMSCNVNTSLGKSKRWSLPCPQSPWPEA